MDVYLVVLPESYFDISQSSPHRYRQAANTFISDVFEGRATILADRRDFRDYSNYKNFGPLFKRLENIRFILGANLTAEDIEKLASANARVLKNSLVTMSGIGQSAEDIDDSDGQENKTVTQMEALDWDSIDRFEEILLDQKTIISTDAIKSRNRANFSERPKEMSPGLQPWHTASIGLSKKSESTARPEKGKNVVVGLIDFGVDTQHDCFSECDILEYREFPFTLLGPSTPSDEIGFAYQRSLDSIGHGTAVASLIAGKHTGVVDNVSFLIAAMKPENTPSGPRFYTTQLVSALNWIEAALRRQKGADTLLMPVLNLSLSDDNESDAYAILEVIKNDFSSLITAPSGNRTASAPSLRVRFPGRSQHCLAIGAHDKSLSEHRNSCREVIEENGKPIQVPALLAPGVDLVVAETSRKGNTLTHKYKRARFGTSYATAIASGVATLLAQRGVRAADLESELVRRARPATTPGKLALFVGH